MNFENKCLLVLKAAEPFHEWLVSMIDTVDDNLKQDFKHCADDKVEISLEEMQSDANCYLIPMLSSEQAIAFLEKEAQAIFEIELKTWCGLQSLWPTINFANFVSAFHFEFFFDWMNFQTEEIDERGQNLSTVLLIVKPNERFSQFLRAQLLERRRLASERGQDLTLEVIQEGSTSVITNIKELDELDYFLDQHAEELISHQLEFWGGKPLQESWSGGFDVKALKSFFEIEIHRKVYFMLH